VSYKSICLRIILIRGTRVGRLLGQASILVVGGNLIFLKQEYNLSLYFFLNEFRKFERLKMPR